MRKATKRVEEDTSESASMEDASPPKKTKSRKVVNEPVANAEPRLPRIAKSKAVEGIERHEAATKKPVAKKAGTESKAKPRGGSKKVDDNVDSDDDSEPPAKKTTARTAKKPPTKEAKEELDEAPKKRGAAKKPEAAPEPAKKPTARGRGKVVQPESDDASESVKPGRSKRGKAVDEDPVEDAPKKGRTKKPVAVADQDESDVEDEAEATKPAKGKKPAPKSRGKKMAVAADPDSADNENDEDVIPSENGSKPSASKQTKGKPAAKKARGKKVAQDDSDADGDAMSHGDSETMENEPEMSDATAVVGNQTEMDGKTEEKDAEDVAEPTKPGKGKKLVGPKPRGKKFVATIDTEMPENEGANNDDVEEVAIAAKKGKTAAKKPRGKKPVTPPVNDDDSDAEVDAAVEMESPEIQSIGNGVEHAQNGKEKLNSSGAGTTWDL